MDGIEAQTLDIGEPFPVSFDHKTSFFYLVIHVAQIAKAHGCRKFIELCIAADTCHRLFIRYPEIHKLVQSPAEGFVFVTDGPAFDRIIDLGGMKTEYRGIPKVSDSLIFVCLAKGVGRIIDDPETVLFGNITDGIRIADVAVYMDRKDRRGFVRDESLQL